MISGMGQGLERGLANLQSGITAYGLQGERLKHDDAARADDRAFQTEKLKEQMAHADALADKQHAFQGKENQATRDQTNALQEDKIDSDEYLHGNQDALKREELGQSKTLKERELATGEKKQASDDEYHKKYVEAIKDRNGRIGGGKAPDEMKDLSATDKETAANYRELGKELMQSAKEEQDPKERKILMRKAEKAFEAGRRVLGEAAPAKHTFIDPDDLMADQATPQRTPAPEVAGASTVAPRPRGERTIAAPSAPPVGPLDALRGGADAASRGLIDLATPYSTVPGITIEKRAQGVR